MPKILSLDGGGTWALVQVRALQEIYGAGATGFDVLRNFDLVVATSGGAIVAEALAAGWPLANILGMFCNQAARQQMFVEIPIQDRIANTVLGIGPKYDTGDKFIGLTNIFGQPFAGTMLNALPAALAQPAQVGKRVDFVVTAFDYDRRRSVLFRSNPASLAAPLTQPPVPNLTAAVHASSTAPVNFFDEPATFPDPAFQGYRFWDGAVTGMNNPVLAGVVEALANQAPASAIQVLSLGTGSVRRPICAGPPPSTLFQQAGSSGIIADVTEVAGAVIDDPPDEASFHAYVALGLPLPRPGDALPLGVGTFVRLSPMIQPIDTPAGYAAPALNIPLQSDLDAFGALVNLGIDAVQASDVALIQALADAWIAGQVYNQPIRSNIALGCEVGYANFAPAKAAWLAANPPIPAPAPAPAPAPVAGGL